MRTLLWSTLKSCNSTSMWFKTVNPLSMIEYNILELIPRYWPLRSPWLTVEPRLISSTSFDHSCMTSFLTANISEGRMMCYTSSIRSIQGQFKAKIKLMVYWVFMKKHACKSTIWILSKFLIETAVLVHFVLLVLFFNWKWIFSCITNKHTFALGIVCCI